MNIYKDTKNKILDALYQNFNNLNENIKNKVTCEQPKNQKFGDVSSNVILVVSKILKKFMKNIYNNKYKIETRRVVNEIKRYIISKMIDDLILETKINISLLDPRSADDVRKMKKPLVAFSKEMNSNILEIRSFLMNKMYRHWKINIMTNKAKNIVSDLFRLYLKEPSLLPLEWSKNLEKTNNKIKARVISDYIAGMTDRYAIREHKKLFDINNGWY